MMQTDFKRALCLFLAAVTAALPLTLASCSEKAAAPGSDTAGGGSGQSQTVSGNQASPEDAPETEAPAPEIDTGLIDELPTDVKYDGEDYVVLSHDHGAAAVAWMVQDIWTEGETGERINDAVFQRNLMMEDRFGVKVAQRLEGDPQAVARTAVTTGADEFAILQTTVQNQAANAINGLTLNMARLPHLNFDKGWWDTSATKSLAVGGKVYYAIGDSQLNAKKATWGVLFNKRLVSDAGIPNLYETVKEGGWTIDLLKEYGTSIARDVNGDGAMTWGEDVWGLGLQNEVVLPLLLGTGEKIIDVHDDGTYDYNLGSDANMTAMERIWSFMNTDADYILNANKHSEISSVWVEFRKLFMADQIAFFMGHLGTPTLVAGDMESDFGILPFPKVSAEQLPSLPKDLLADERLMRAGHYNALGLRQRAAFVDFIIYFCVVALHHISDIHFVFEHSPHRALAPKPVVFAVLSKIKTVKLLVARRIRYAQRVELFDYSQNAAAAKIFVKNHPDNIRCLIVDNKSVAVVRSFFIAVACKGAYKLSLQTVIIKRSADIHGS